MTNHTLEDAGVCMKISLVSEDRNLYGLCREALASTRRSSSVLSAFSDPAHRSAADFCIWDVDSGTPVPEDADLDPARCLFLVDRYDLDRFRKSAGRGACNILLKPVTRANLAVFLDLAFSTAESGASAGLTGASAEALLQTSLRLQKHDQERTAFLASVAHDLRAPATALAGYCGLLLDREGDTGDEIRKNILRSMQSSAARLSRMVSAIFELSVELRSAHRIDARPEDMVACIGQAWHEVSLIAEDKSLEMAVSIDPPEGDLCFDRTLIERVLINIFENACRFAPVNGKIGIKGYPFFWERRNTGAIAPAAIERRIPVERSGMRRRPNSFRVDIVSSAPAIPDDLLEYIFEEYVTLEPNRKESGGGLGLAICRTIIAGHRGRIWAENTEAGPRFSFVLPGGRPQSGMDAGAIANRRLNETTGLSENNVAV